LWTLKLWVRSAIIENAPAPELEFEIKIFFTFHKNWIFKIFFSFIRSTIFATMERNVDFFEDLALCRHYNFLSKSRISNDKMLKFELQAWECRITP
jgi:hypothetical protein